MNPWVAVGVLLIGFATGWVSRAVLADRDMSAYKLQLVAKQNDQRDLTLKVEAAATKNTADSTSRIDTTEKAQAVEVRYVEKKVTEYRDRPVAGKCKLPAEWVQLYNQSGRVPNGVPETGATGFAPAGGAAAVR